MQKHEYAHGTYILYGMPWGIYLGGATLCPDGKVRKLKRIAQTADTFFSVPASVTYKGKTIAGYITISDCLKTDRSYVNFVPYEYRKNGKLFLQGVHFISLVDFEWAAKYNWGFTRPHCVSKEI